MFLSMSNLNPAASVITNNNFLLNNNAGQNLNNFFSCTNSSSNLNNVNNNINTTSAYNGSTNNVVLQTLKRRINKVVVPLDERVNFLQIKF